MNCVSPACHPLPCSSHTPRSWHTPLPLLFSLASTKPSNLPPYSCRMQLNHFWSSCTSKGWGKQKDCEFTTGIFILEKPFKLVIKHCIILCGPFAFKCLACPKSYVKCFDSGFAFKIQPLFPWRQHQKLLQLIQADRYTPSHKERPMNFKMKNPSYSCHCSS